MLKRRSMMIREKKLRQSVTPSSSLEWTPRVVMPRKKNNSVTMDSDFV